MQLESHATPPGSTPQQRYASLHRALEQGLDSDDIWFELAQVSANLGHVDEAVRCVERVGDSARRSSLEKRLARRLGTKARFGSDTAAAGAAPAAAAAPTPTPKAPIEAPAASNAGRSAESAERKSVAPGVTDHLLDAVQYLLHQHMPWLVLTTMLAFPLVVGLGGFLTAGGSPLLLAAIAALPGLSVLAVVAAMGRQILLTSSEGVCDVPDLPDFGRLVADARRFGADALLVAALFFGLPTGLLLVDAPWPSVLSAFALGAFFAPVAFALRQIRGDMRALAPVILARAVRCCGTGYPVVAAVTILLFAPAAGLAWVVFDRPIWVQIAILGPLCVLPVFLASRLLGSWMDTRRQALGYLLRGRQQMLTGNGNANAEAPAEKPSRPRFPRRPEALEAFQAPVVNRQNTSGQQRTRPSPASALRQPPKAARQAPAATPPAQHPARPTPRAIEGRRPAQQRPAAPKPEAQRRPAAGRGESCDLADMPGAFVVSGEERARRGAAARRP